MRLNRISVQAWRGREIVGSATFTRYGVADNYDMTHPTVWSSSKTDVEAAWRRRGVAQAIYGHLKRFDYRIAPAPVLLHEGQELWAHGLDPNVAMAGASSFSRGTPVRTPPLPAPPHRDDLSPEGFLGRFEIEKTLGAELFSNSQKVAQSLSQEPFPEFRRRLGLVFQAPDEALVSVLLTYRSDEQTAAQLLSKPTELGALIPMSLGRRMLGKRRRALLPASSMVPFVLGAWRSAKLADEERLRCVYSADCRTWLGHPTPPFDGD